MRVRPFGERAFEVAIEGELSEREAAARARRLAATIARDPRVREAIAGYGVVVAIVDERADRTRLPARLAELAHAPVGEDEAPAKEHVVGAVYDGPDLRAVADAHGLSIDALVSRHAGATYEVEILGFLPGFAYLGGLDPALATPRRAAPRPRVAAGSIGVAGARTAIYPLASPGGWNLLGRAVDCAPFDPSRAPPSLFHAGDRVRFEVRAIAPDQAHEPRATARAVTPRTGNVARGLAVERVGPLATLQDAGRPGWASAAVPAGGPLDRESFARAVAAVGGAPDDAAIELPRLGAAFRAIGDVVVSIDGEPARHLRDGERLEVSRAETAVRYLAVAGGFDVPRVLGARATLVVAALGGLDGRPLVRGDVVPIGPDHGTHAHALARGALPIGGDLELQVHADAPEAALAALGGAELRVDARSDRVGIRLSGAPIPGGQALARSRPLVPGAVQLPPDGNPIVIGPDGPTVGGYPLLGVLSAASLAKLGRTPPGRTVRLRSTA